MTAIAGVIIASVALTTGTLAASSSSRIVSPTVVSSFLANDDEITLLVLWRGSDPVPIAIRRYPELFDYLQCETPLPASAMPPGQPAPVQQYMQATLTVVCEQMRGR